MKTFFKKFTERFIEGILMLSGTITTLTVLLIVVFLFREGLGLFSESPVINNNVIVVNSKNTVTYLKALQIKDIYDGKITNWKELGGLNDTIITFSVNDISSYYSEEYLAANMDKIPVLISHVVDSIPQVLAVFQGKYFTKDFKGKQVHVDKLNIPDFIKGKQWFPTAEPVVQLGILPILLGTFWVSLGAILIALPIGLATAIYMAEVASPKLRNILKPVIELLAGIPSVVYGFFGLIVIVPLIQKMFNLPVGETALAGSIVLGIMALPTIITVSEDAIRNTPRTMKEASLALGANRWQTIQRVILPYSISGITAAAILGIGRAMGETMAVLMVTGNAAVMPHTFLQPVRTIPATIAAELGESSQGGVHYKALFALGCLLFIMTLIVNLIVEYITSKRKLSR